MNIPKRKLIICLSTVAAFLFVVNALAYSAAYETLLPEDPIIEDSFEPGYGVSVGKVEVVRGKVVIMHADKERGYYAKRGLPLYKGDIIVTLSDGRIKMKLKDESVITMVSNTRLTISKSIFNRAKRRFVSFLKMSIGKARFLVRKVRNMQHPEYRVKTPTAVVGVRGSDFVSEVREGLTIISAFEDTELGVANVLFPEQLVIVTDNYRTMVKEGTLPTDPMLVPPDEIELMKRDFQLTADEVDEEGDVVEEEEAIEEVEEEVKVDKKDLVEPAEPGPAEGYEGIDPQDLARWQSLTELEDDLGGEREDIEESFYEENASPPLPEFPETP